MEGRAAIGPQFAKVYVRQVDWRAAETEPSTYTHSTWADPFVLTELNLEGTVEELIIVAICRWGRGVLPYVSLYLANGGGRMLTWRPCEDRVGHHVTFAGGAEELMPLDPTLPIASIPRFELPLAFVLVTKPSSFVPRPAVLTVLAALQDRVVREKEAPLQAARETRDRQRALEGQRKVRIAELEAAQRRREVKAVLQSHHREDVRLVQMHQNKSGGSTQ